MGLFSSKKKVTVDDMAMQMMLAAVDVIGKIECFNDISDERSMAVNMGYFYGFLKLHLNSITKLETADVIIRKSINHIIRATKGQNLLENFGHTVLEIADKAVENMKYAAKQQEKTFLCMAIFYMTDLHGTSTVDIDKADIAEKNMRALYGITANLTKDIKIVK